MSEQRDRLRDRLASIPYPGFDRDIVSLGIVQTLELDDERLRVVLRFADQDAQIAQSVADRVRAVVGPELAGRTLDLVVEGPSRGAPSLNVVGPGTPKGSTAAGGAVDPKLIPDVRHVVAVASGKGGVGKSTVAVNLAIGLARRGLRVGLLDADIYGPSVPLMLGLQGQEPLMEGQRLVPFAVHGIRAMSLGFLVPADRALIWRGPMVMKALEQLLRDVAWGSLDVLVVDMPPGTGDAQLTLSQRIRLRGAVIVTTPQDLALADAIKGVAMFQKVGVEILGVVENMSYHICSNCGAREEIFGAGGGRSEAKRLGVPFLGEIPLHTRVRDGGDQGKPVVVAAPDSVEAQALVDAADQIAERLAAEAPAGEDGTVFDRFKSMFKGRTP